MSNKPKIIKIVSSVVMLTCVAVIVISNINLGPKPALECVDPGSPSSGFSDPNQNNCPVSAKSINARADWEKGIFGEFKYTINRTVAVIFVIALIGLITGVVMSKKAKKRAKVQDQAEVKE